MNVVGAIVATKIPGLAPKMNGLEMDLFLIVVYILLIIPAVYLFGLMMSRGWHRGKREHALQLMRECVEKGKPDGEV